MRTSRLRWTKLGIFRKLSCVRTDMWEGLRCEQGEGIFAISCSMFVDGRKKAITVYYFHAAKDSVSQTA